MARILRQSTSVDVPIGPFTDQTDGFSPETALTITQPDIRLKKNGGAWAQKNAAQTLSHEENGNYEVTLDATDTNTLGLLRLHVNESGALPVWEDFWVVTANFWDSLFSTDLLQVDVITIANNAITDASIATSAISDIRSVATGTADSGSTTTVVDTERTETDTDYWKDCLIVFGSTLAGQTRLITGFNPATDTITFAPATTVAVSGGHPYEILPAARVDLHLWQGTAPNPLTSGRVDTVVGEVTAGAIDDDAVAADMDSYSAKIWLFDDNSGTADRYEVAWFKNARWVSSGITSATVQVVKSLDGSNLVAETAMTEIGSLHLFKKTESANRIVSGASYWVIARATIDGSTREWPQPVGRDSV